MWYWIAAIVIVALVLFAGIIRSVGSAPTGLED